MIEKVSKYINSIQLEELYREINNCPHKLLGPHKVEEGQLFITYRINASEVTIIDKETNTEYSMLPYEDRGLYVVLVEGEAIRSYEIRTKYLDNTTITIADPYSFGSRIGDLDTHLFRHGTHYEIYKKLGAHVITINGVKGTYFAVWAPNAKKVSVVGEFNCWDGRLHPMRLLESCGIHELFIPGVEEGAIYKYQIRTRDDRVLYKVDPYANSSELRPKNASVVADLTNYRWEDKVWQKKKYKKDRNSLRKEAMSIYEMHLGSWRKHNNGTEDGFYNYRELAVEVADYVSNMGYTHVELLGIAEHPFDGSWGYQVTGYYAPTRRYGKPEDFMFFVDYLHRKGIGVILDWVPAHFPKDDFGLSRFDGEPLYEYPNPKMGEHPEWGTYIFNYSKKEVINFLLANALFWLKEFHLDGLRVDAVASMLYLDYGKNAGEWIPNKNGGRENLDVVEFFRHMNAIIQEKLPWAMMIAEESTSWEGVTAPAKANGLGFLYKWNMGWMNDFLEYMKLDPYFRQFNHHKLTFSLMYAYSENFIQVLSHDEVVHGKGSMIQKMPGEYDDKFANLRVAYGFMYAHPGKKLLFMGQEFAQWQEWSEARGLDWGILEYERHAQMQQYVKSLNHLYRRYNALYANDCEAIGFEWLDCTHAGLSLISFIRRGTTKKNHLLVVCNFTPVDREDYEIGVLAPGTYTQIFNSDLIEFGGKGNGIVTSVRAVQEEYNNKPYKIRLAVPGLSFMAFRYNE
ncbi:MAG TPA: 1,4-alpha-glucan branching enzyme [Lachnospiraceae bacterium]|uniref:1,4-alpha-glucan branching protein GlgB n=1 Tax=Anaerosporobacter sp. TaxID=1872529 RepID=UPI000EE4B598|nr:1,4-alpha-glucan branching protein GlgB [Anaerosporobacter sp.]HAB61668.1 1,4-alpha-glucan branching enzyme [Lachnospiraceae bacterium]